MLLYFVTISVLGVMHIAEHPAVMLAMINPLNALQFFLTEPLPAFIAMGSVVLAVTGAEALYADMGHFGRNPISSLALLRHAGADAQLYGAGRDDPGADAGRGASRRSRTRSSCSRPRRLRLPLVILATLATIIASQAVISGAFSVTQQAIQLGFIPRLRIRTPASMPPGRSTSRWSTGR